MKVTPHDDLFKVINRLMERVDALDGGDKEEEVKNPDPRKKDEVFKSPVIEDNAPKVPHIAPAFEPQPDAMETMARSSHYPVVDDKKDQEPAKVEEIEESKKQAEEDPRFDVKPAEELVEDGVEIDNPAKVEETKKGTEGSKPEQTI